MSAPDRPPTAEADAVLRVDYAYVAKAMAADKAANLYPLLQGAIQLEHATIPPYLVAAYSIDLAANRES